jgi:hypothetical protein
VEPRPFFPSNGNHGDEQQQHDIDQTELRDMGQRGDSDQDGPGVMVTDLDADGMFGFLSILLSM